jgi:signal transduction histidine kinase/signal recognition particle receptor subunit beta
VVEINHREHFIRAKILYYGPAAGGKTTNLQALHRRALKEKRLDLVSVNTAQDRTILFDLLPLTTPAFRSYELRFQIVAVPGQRLYAATRKMLLKNADAVVFVSNSASDRWDENLQSMKEMTEHLLGHGVDPSALPVIFQYNKRDLPNTTDVEMMERGLNARSSDSFPAIAIRDQGVLETFAAALRRTMTELSTRYNIGDSLSTPRSALEWTERTMRETFGVTGVAEKRKELRELEPRPTPRTPFRPPTVVRVKTPSQPRTSLSSTPPQSPSVQTSTPTPQVAPSPSPTPVSPEPSSKEAASVTSAAAELQEAKATMSLIESYAEAASGLGDHISHIREEKDEAFRWLEEMSAVADMTRDLITGSGLTTDTPLKALVNRMAQTLRTSTASLSILRPDGVLEPVVLAGLEADPVVSGSHREAQSLGQSLLESDKPTIQKRGESGLLDAAIERAGRDCVAVVTLPLKTPSKPVGLLTFYLPQEASLPNTIFMDYLEKAALQIATTLEAASNTLASDRMERSLKEAFAGRVSRHAIRWIEEPLAQIESAAARLRAQPEASSWLGEGLLQIENNILKLKSMRQSVVGLGVGLLPAKAPTSISDLLREVEAELKEHLSQAGIRLQIEAKADLATVRAEPFLLWSILSHLIEDARRSLAGIPSGGVIQVIAQTTSKGVRLAVFDNAVAVAPKATPSRYLAWPLDRRLRDIESGLVQPVVEYLQAQFTVETRTGVGTMRTLVLPKA